MIEGLVHLPKIQSERARQIDKDIPVQIANEYMNCELCRLDETERGLWRCGWLPEERRLDVPMRPFPDADVCPGYTTTMPEVIEASRLLLWTRRGQLEAVVESLPIPVATSICIDILDGACRESEAEGYRRQRREAEAKRS